jgi:hypothetical protein
MENPSLSSTVANDMVDIIIPSMRGAETVSKILLAAAQNPTMWMRHNFIIIFDADDETESHALRKWVETTREEMPLPNTLITTALPQNRGNVAAIREQGVELGSKPFVYFQDDDDPLPDELETFLSYLLKNEDTFAAYGVCCTINSRGQIIEHFPPVINGSYTIDPYEGMRYFPTYPHPLAALFRRSIFKNVPIYDASHNISDGNAFFSLRLTNSGLKLKFLTETLRTVQHHAGNDTGIMSDRLRMSLAHDIVAWRNLITDPDIVNFQAMVAEELKDGMITTYKEIDALVEEHIEMHKQ